MMSIEEIKKNVILLGDGAVGKTSLIRRFVLDQFTDNYIATIGSKVTKKEVRLLSESGDPVRMTLMIWDVIGQKEYGLTQALSMRNIDGAMIVADLTRKDTLESLQGYWIPKTIATRGRIPLIFLGNKDDVGDRKFGLADIKKVAKDSKAFGDSEMADRCFLTSAKTGANIEEAFRLLAQALLSSAEAPVVKKPLARAEIKTLANVVDMIITDFANQYGGIDVATPIVRHQMERAGLDPKNPSPGTIRLFIENMASIEKSFKPPEEVASKRAERIQILASVKS